MKSYVFLAPIDSFGGLEMQLVRRAYDARVRGYSASVVCIKGTSVEHYARSLSVPVDYLRITIKYADIFAAIRLGAILRHRRADVCVVSKTDHLSIAIFARNHFMPNTAVVFYQQMQSGIRKIDPFHNWVYKNIDSAIVLTNIMKKELTESTIFPDSKIGIIPCGIETANFISENYNKAEARSSFGLPADKFIFGNVAKICQHKDQTGAVEAFALAGIENSLLVIAGGVDKDAHDYHRHLLDLPSHFGVKDKVVFLPFTNQVGKLMNCFDAFVFPSRSETFGLVIVEAMAAGLAVIATDCGGVPEIISHGTNGLLFRQEYYRELARLMKALADDGSLRSRLGSQAKRDSIARYEYKAQSEKFFEFCDQAVKERNL